MARKAKSKLNPAVKQKPKNEESALQAEINQPHATYFEQVFKIVSFAIAFLKFALDKTGILEQIDLTKIKVDKRSFFDMRIYKDSFADMVYTAPLKKDPNRDAKIFILLEHKSYNDFLTIFQIAYYAMQILFFDVKKAIREKRMNRQYRLPLIVPIIIHHGRKRFTGATQLRRLFPKIGGFTRYLFGFQAILIDLNRYQLEEIPDDPNEWRLNIVLKVMKLIFNENDYQSVEDCFRKLFPYIQHIPEHVDFAKLTIRYFLDGSRIDNDWFKNMILDYYTEEQGEQDMLTMREQLIERGRQEGRQEERQRRIDVIIKVLADRFGRVPLSIKKRLESVCDDVVLDSIYVQAALSASLEEFQKNL